MDFTLKTYKRLLKTFLSNGYSLITYETYCSKKPDGKFLILRHDVDELAFNALKMAEVENALGVKATYYFRIVKQSNQPDIIRKIVELGHEIGYHYEDLSFSKGNFEIAKKTFEENLKYFRTYYPVKTVCMHGSSTSKYDNRDFWGKYNLKDFALIGEPYLTTDFEKVFYFTDTGYAWDGGKYSVRDVVENKFGLTFHSSKQIMEAVNKGNFPQQNLMLAHTLWSDNISQWFLLHLREFLRNNLKYFAQRNKILKKIYSGMVKAYWER
ncbi:Polysaccharide deacetylase [uncultured Paludibacter sp.]|uniref:Polysaccharide deacetylase n=1 Tax=uncultured Paludibacter sp. TaxID=497635 RepID=A0A653AAB0_9BACT|nr:Polysaccharide deacetylase [uncultured Paludibacter sp.]